MLKKLFNKYTIALGAIALTAWFAREPKVCAVDKETLAKAFKLERQVLQGSKRTWTTDKRLFTQRFQHLEGWLKAFIPAGVAAMDLDGDGKDNDLCFTDAFENRIWVSQVVSKTSKNSFDLLPPALPAGEKSFPTGCLLGDFDQNGKTDILVYFWGRTPVAFLRDTQSRELAASSFKATELFSPRERWHTESITTGDIDGDGNLDLVVANYMPEHSNVVFETPNGTYEMNEGAGNAQNGAYNRLLLGSPASPTFFTEAKGAFGDKEGGAQWTIAAAAIDLDSDQLPEVLFINDHGPDRLLHNRSTPGKPKFELVVGRRDLTTPKSITFGLDSFHGMGIDFADLNKDGALDFLVSNFNASYLFYQANFAWMNTGEKDALKNGKAPFVSKAEKMGFARTDQVPWDLRLQDFNNDGKMEIFQSTGFMRGKTPRKPEVIEFGLWNDAIMKYPIVWHNFNYNDEISGTGPNSLFTQGADGRYVDVGSLLNLQEEGVSRGASTTDLDGDGRMDLLVNHQNADPTALFNSSPSGSFLGLVLNVPFKATTPEEILVNEGLVPTSSSNLASRRAIGAEVTVYLPDGRKLATTVDGGSGFGGKKSPVVHVGLGTLSPKEQVSVDIQWRDAKGETHLKKVSLKPGWHTLQLGRSTILATSK